MRKFRNKQVVIEAVQFINYADVREFCGNKVREQIGGPIEKDCLGIDTLEGVIKVSIGDWIIKDVNGEFYPCKPNVFEKTYEEVYEEQNQLSE